MMPASETPETPSKAAARSVLVVDDHPAFGELLAAALTAAGLRCVGVLSDATGLPADVERLNPDVVLMDIEMPGTDGITATHLLRASHPRVAVVVTSAYLTGRRRLQAQLAGASAVVPKDGSLAVMLEALRSAVPPPDTRIEGYPTPPL